MMKTRAIYFLLTLLFLARRASAVNPSNCTLAAITGGTFDLNCHILCRPAKWNDLAVFYIGNYIAHAVTIRNPPGRATSWAFMTVILALLFPISGLVEGVRAIASRAVFAKTPLQCAARAGALYEVVKTGSRRTSVPNQGGNGDSYTNLPTSDTQNINARDIELQDIDTAGQPGDIEAQHSRETAIQPIEGPLKANDNFERKIHGRVSLPSGWRLREVPWGATFDDDDATSQTEKAVAVLISRDYSFTKSAIALGQTLYAISTLYNTRGGQIQQFGYAAFGFTVIPYAFMSILNFIGNLICPEYPCMYVVESDDLRRLREIIASQGKESMFYVEGTVGRFRGVSGRAPEDQVLAYILTMSALLGIHIGLIGGLTKFHKEDSTHAQRVWTMIWLGLGAYVGLSLGVPQVGAESEHRDSILDESGGIGIALSAFVVGGFVVVGQMILQFGICEQI